MSKPRKFLRKPIPVEAMRLTDYGPINMEIYNWVESYVGGFGYISLKTQDKGVSVDPKTGFMLIATIEGVMQAKPGDWIVRDELGDFYPCVDRLFKTRYDEVIFDKEE